MKPHAVLLSLSLLASAWAGESKPQPNVVIFLADDAGWGDYSHSGNTQVVARRTALTL